MSTKYLGQPFDIHGGGLENKFPHHECEIAQSEAANGVQFVRYWLHNNMVTVDGQKMGKSLNNFITLKQAFSGTHERLTRSYNPLAVRQLVLNSHYRSPLDFSDAALFAAQSGYEKITAAVLGIRIKENSAPEGDLDAEVARKLEDLREKFEAAMNDDLNTSVALATIFELVRFSTSLLNQENTTKKTLDAVDQLFRKLGGEVLGIVEESYSSTKITVEQEKRFIKLIDSLMEKRKEARQKKDFQTSDMIRDALIISDITVIDEADGTSTWREK